jgi:cell division septation protein DedD
MKIGSYSLLVLMTVMLLCGCGKSRKKPVTAEEPPGRELPSQAPENRVQPGLPEAMPLPGEAGSEEEPGTRYGYRVQVAAYTQTDPAERRAAELRSLFGEPVYIVHEGLLYKIQVGDFVSRDRAQAIRRKAIDLGLDGAFVVDTMIKAP